MKPVVKRGPLEDFQMYRIASNLEDSVKKAPTKYYLLGDISGRRPKGCLSHSLDSAKFFPQGLDYPSRIDGPYTYYCGHSSIARQVRWTSEISCASPFWALEEHLTSLGILFRPALKL